MPSYGSERFCDPEIINPETEAAESWSTEEQVLDKRGQKDTQRGKRDYGLYLYTGTDAFSFWRHVEHRYI